MTEISPEFRQKIEEGDVDLNVFEHPRCGKQINYSQGSTEIDISASDEEQLKNVIDQYEDIIVKVHDIIEDHEAGRITLIERNWEIGKALVQAEETADESAPEYFPNNKIVGNSVDLSGDSISDYTIVYRAFPNKNFNWDEHTQTEIREFAVESISTDRGVRGYHKYDDNEYDWPTFVRRSWCTTPETELSSKETIDQYVRELYNKRQLKFGKSKLAEYLYEMIQISDMNKELTQEECDNRIREFPK